MDVRRQAQAHDNSFADIPAAPKAQAGTSNPLSKVLAILLILVSVVTLGWFGNKAYSAMTADGAVKAKQYQAVFLTNGQVYFGKASRVDNSYVKLTDIYYLQVQQQVQPKDQSAGQQPQVSLAKLGGELHGPEDVMYVSRQQVLFWENLKDDGKVAKAIKDYKASGK
ncbi:MAG: hypothetical protein JWN01_143 [Patescibacteria group bacterium]|nr:hypothetical protein [Patescibacteria group bacterium]